MTRTRTRTRIMTWRRSSEDCRVALGPWHHLKSAQTNIKFIEVCNRNLNQAYRSGAGAIVVGVLLSFA